MPLDDLQNLERVKSHLTEVYKAYMIIDRQLKAIKEEVKSFENDMQYWDVTLKYSKYIKLKPVDINTIIERYPIANNPELYNITLSKEAQHIITDESLFTQDEVKLIRMEVNDEE